MSSNRKRAYESGARKRAEKKRKIEGAAANTKPISLFFEKAKTKTYQAQVSLSRGKMWKKMSRVLSLMNLMKLLTRTTKM